MTASGQDVTFPRADPRLRSFTDDAVKIASATSVLEAHAEYGSRTIGTISGVDRRPAIGRRAPRPQRSGFRCLFLGRGRKNRDSSCDIPGVEWRREYLEG